LGKSDDHYGGWGCVLQEGDLGWSREFGPSPHERWSGLGDGKASPFLSRKGYCLRLREYPVCPQVSVRELEEQSNRLMAPHTGDRAARVDDAGQTAFRFET